MFEIGRFYEIRETENGLIEASVRKVVDWQPPLLKMSSQGSFDGIIFNVTSVSFHSAELLPNAEKQAD